MGGQLSSVDIHNTQEDVLIVQGDFIVVSIIILPLYDYCCSLERSPHMCTSGHLVLC